MSTDPQAAAMATMTMTVKGALDALDEYFRAVDRQVMREHVATLRAALHERETREPVAWEQIAAVARWQANDDVHPLTCGNNSGHNPLVPAFVGGAVMLVCLDCSYKQLHIPVPAPPVASTGERERTTLPKMGRSGKEKAWDAVCDVLDDVAPGWTQRGNSGIDSASKAIRSLAQRREDAE